MTGPGAGRILLSAYQCGPGMGSVSQIGWEWYRRLAGRVQTTLVTHSRNRPALERAGAPLPGSEVLFVDTEWFAGPLYRTSRRLFPHSEHSTFLLSSLDFFVFDRAARRLAARRLAAGEGWDLVHQVTPVSAMAPTRLSSLGLPLVVGPLNSGLANPPGFGDLTTSEASWLYPLRNLGRLLDGLVGSTRRARAILVATQATRHSFPRRHQERLIPMLENGVDLERFRPAPWPAVPSASEPLRLLFAGRLVPFKGVPLLLEAVNRLRTEQPIRLRVVGDGPMRAEWQAQAGRLGLADTVEFVGACSLDEVAAAMRWAHVFCLPSVRESGGAVLLEAMASARPVVAIRFGGPGELVDEAVGRAVELGAAEEITAGLVDALRDVVGRPEAWRARGEEGRRRAESLYSWNAKVEQALRLYEKILSFPKEAPAASPVMRAETARVPSSKGR